MARKRKISLRKLFEKRWASAREKLYALPWKKAARKLNRPHVLLALVSVGVAIGAIDWAANRLSTPPVDRPNNQVPVPDKDPLSGLPWSYFRPAWKEESSWLVRIVRPNSQLTNSAKKVRDLVTDPDGRTESEFQVPDSLKDRVAFWMEVYSRYNSRMRVVHDRVDPGIIYGYIDFRPIYRTAATTMAGDIKANDLEKKILKELKARLEEAAGITSTSLMSVSEKDKIQNLLSRFGAKGDKETKDLISRIRTQSGQSDMFLSALYRSRQLLPHIESVFKRQNLPIGLGRIPFVESSFNERAYSKGGAVGIWQFMPETAKQMIHPDDEHWADPLKQTASAARLLKMYRAMLPDWGSTVTSYNSGVGRVRRLMTKYKLKNVEELLNVEDDDGLGFAGKNFYAEFLAANLVEAYKDVLFEKAMESQTDFSLVLKGLAPFPKDFCDM